MLAQSEIPAEKIEAFRKTDYRFGEAPDAVILRLQVVERVLASRLAFALAAAVALVRTLAGARGLGGHRAIPGQMPGFAAIVALPVLPLAALAALALPFAL